MYSGIVHEVLCPNDLDAGALNVVVTRLKPLYQWYAPTATEEQIRRRITGHHNTEIDLLGHDGAVIAFGICVLMSLPNAETCLFRHGAIIDDRFRSQGLYHRLFALARARHRPNWHGTRTQNPRVYETWWKMFGKNLYPNPHAPLTPELKSLAAYIVPGGTFEVETFVVRDAYSEDRSGVEYHRCREAWIEQFFRSQLGVHDAFLLLVRES